MSWVSNNSSVKKTRVEEVIFGWEIVFILNLLFVTVFLFIKGGR